MPSPVRGRDRYAVRMLVQCELDQRRILHAVEFVEDHNHLLTPRAQFLEHHLHRLHLLLVQRMAQVDDVQQQVRLRHLFQRRLDDSIRWWGNCFKNPTVSVSSSFCLFRQNELPRRRVQRREKLVRRVHVRFRHAIEQGSIFPAFVYPTSETIGQCCRSRPARCVSRCCRTSVNSRESRAIFFGHAPAVDLELRSHPAPAVPMPRSAPRQVRPHAGQPRQEVLQLRQLDLQLAVLRRLRPLRENVQDQLRAVQNFPAENFLEIAALRRRQLVVENHRADVLLLATVAPVRRPCLRRCTSPPPATARRWIAVSTTSPPALFTSSPQFLQRLGVVPLVIVRRLEPDQKRALIARRGGSQVGRFQDGRNL